MFWNNSSRLADPLVTNFGQSGVTLRAFLSLEWPLVNLRVDPDRNHGDWQLSATIDWHHWQRRRAKAVKQIPQGGSSCRM
jgi:hypothetical protein